MGDEIALGLAGEALGGAVDGVDVVVAIVEEVAHLLPGGLGAALRDPAQRLVQRGEAFMGLAIGAVQVEEGAGERRRVGGGEAQVRERRGGVGEDGIGDGLAHVGDKAFGVAGAELGDVEAELRARPRTTAVETGRLLFSIWLR
jgi:hypothetical protein